MKQFKIRSSQSAKIVSNGKGSDISAGAKTYCQNWAKEQLYNRRNEFTSEYTQKGNEVEDESIDFVANYYNLGFVIKNDEFFENEWITGTPDVITPNVIIDVKNSWDCFTFPLFDTKIPKPDYYWQAQSYMDLLGINEYWLIYTLINTPEHLIESEARSWSFKNGYEQLDQDVYERFHKQMTYDSIHDKLKIKRFIIRRNQDDIDKLHNKVTDCRAWIKSNLDQFLTQ